MGADHGTAEPHRAVQGDRDDGHAGSCRIRSPTTYFGLQQLRWSPENIADTPPRRWRVCSCCRARTTARRNSRGSSRWRLAPSVSCTGRGLGPQFEGDLFVAAARPFLEGGHLFHFNLTGNRRAIGTDDPRLEDRVADNLHKWEITESESLLIGRNFGVGTDIQTGPNGNLFIVSLSNGAVYEVFRARQGPR